MAKYIFNDVYDIASYDDVLLIKFIGESNIDDFLLGNIYFPLLKTFWGLENGPQSDDKEGKLVLSNIIDNATIKDLETGKMYYKNKILVTQSHDIISAGNLPLCCFSHADPSSPKDLQLLDKSDTILSYKFSESFINDLSKNTNNNSISMNRPFVILSLKDLFQKVKKLKKLNKLKKLKILKKLKKLKILKHNPPFKDFELNYDLDICAVNYVDYSKLTDGSMSNISKDEYNSNRLAPAFTKDISYSDQHELRLILTPQSDTPVTLPLGLLNDITKIYSADTKLEDFTFTYDIKNRKFTVNPPKEKN